MIQFTQPNKFEKNPNFTSIHTAETQPVQVGVHKPVLKVMGLGGGGQNAVNRMIEFGLEGIEFIVANTDVQALKNSLAPVQIALGNKLTRGLGAGGTPEIGLRAAEESAVAIRSALQGADMVFLTAGMGGGTGTGSISVAAKIARSLGAVTVAIVTTPFTFEGGRRGKNATWGLEKLGPNTDTLISIPNDRLLQVAPRNLSLEMSFRLADDVLRQAVQGITDLIVTPKFINVDFANIANLMKLGGGALMSSGRGTGEHRAIHAIDQALHHPMLESASMDTPSGVLVNFTSGGDLSLLEVNAAMEFLHKQIGHPGETIMGIAYDERLQDTVEVILVATGLGSRSLEDALPGFASTPRRPSVAETSSESKIQSEAAARTTNQEMATAQQAMTRSPKTTNVRTLVYEAPTGSSSNDLDIPAFLRRR